MRMYLVRRISRHRQQLFGGANSADKELTTMGRRKHHGTVVVLNASFEPLGIVTLNRAMTMLLRERATVVDSVPGEVYRSASSEFPVPRVVQYREMVRVPYSWKTEPWTRGGLLRRDNHTCAYCGKYGNTVDHVLPRSRGGGDTWLNTVAACSRCNNGKANKTPEEAGMKLRYQPREVLKRDSLVLAIAELGVDTVALGLAPA